MIILLFVFSITVSVLLIKLSGLINIQRLNVIFERGGDPSNVYIDFLISDIDNKIELNFGEMLL